MPAELCPLLYASTHQSADVLYLGGVSVPDPILALVCHGRSIAVVNRLEYARVRRDGRFDEVLSWETWAAKAREKFGQRTKLPVDILRLLAEEFDLPGFLVPHDFPTGLAFDLKNRRLKVKVAEGMIFPQRAFKRDDEAAGIRAGNAASAGGFRVVENALRASAVRDGKLYFEGDYLTSERLQRLIEIDCLQRGAESHDTIVAGGDQACDPHHRGAGPLRPNELIVVDIFPKDLASGYHGDMTRTYLKGKASEQQRVLVETVLEAQQTVLKQHVAGANGRDLYQWVCEFFESKGFKTEDRDGVPVGFFHGLGHGLGLEVHEPPRVSRIDDVLQPGHVVTVEPGLYYPGLGGCRIEDVVRIRENGAPELLSEHPYDWEIA
ncbi:MAG: Xaa-Pro peptidase family protein [Verrucomicrobiota bacterium JB022]|nr:Xaa-Pro peptidase family protein [Verrucomicrobiota bacterium JB022]